MKQAISFLFTPSFHSLSIIFAFIGSCLIFIPPIIPEKSLQSFGEAIFPLTQPGAAAVFINAFQSLGIEFYGGAILSYAFGVIDEKSEQTREKQSEKQIKMLLSEIEVLKSKIDGLTEMTTKQVEQSTSIPKKPKVEGRKSVNNKSKKATR